MHFKLLKFLFKDVRGKEISAKYRADHSNIDDKSLTFGEIHPQSFLQLLAITNPLDYTSKSRTFVDLGCGTGKACFSAALSPFLFEKVIGIEIITELTQVAILVHFNLLIVNKPCISIHRTYKYSYLLDEIVKFIIIQLKDTNNSTMLIIIQQRN